MDLIRPARDEIACEEKSRRSEDFESFEANDRCDNGQSAPARYFAVHAELMLPTGPRHESWLFSYRGPVSMDLRCYLACPIHPTSALLGAETELPALSFRTPPLLQTESVTPCRVAQLARRA
jgi:hypothetical protein